MRASSVRQVSGFLGKGIKASKLSKSQSVTKALLGQRRASIGAGSTADSSSPTRSPSRPDSPASPIEEPEDRWRRSRVAELAFLISYEIRDSLEPFSFRRWVSEQLAGNEEKLADVFNLAVLLSPVVSDYAKVGCYSFDKRAVMYKQLALLLPRLVLAASFGNDEVAANIKMFMEKLLAAEESISEKEAAMIDVIVRQDRGPTFYWLLNERDLWSLWDLGSLGTCSCINL